MRAGLDRLEQERIGDRFVVVGLCSGSSWAFQAALEDPRIAAAFMINPRILYWDEAIDVERDLRRTRLLVKPVIWKRILRGDVSADRFAAFLGWAAKAPVARTRPANGRAEAVTDGRAGRAGIRSAAGRGDRAPVLLLRRRALHEEMSRDGLLAQRARWPNVAVSFLPGRDHTLRPLWMHEHVDAALDAALDGILAGS